MAQNDVAAEEQFSAQFPEIENLLTTEDFSGINERFQTLYKALENQSKSRSGLGIGKQKDAKKAMLAMESVMSLLKELLKLKYETAAATSSPMNTAKKV